MVIGQYTSHNEGSTTYPAYTDDKTVPKGSLTPTFAAAALFINNARWEGVPFLMKAGKALQDRRYLESLKVADSTYLYVILYKTCAFCIAYSSISHPAIQLFLAFLHLYFSGLR